MVLAGNSFVPLDVKLGPPSYHVRLDMDESRRPIAPLPSPTHRYQRRKYVGQMMGIWFLASSVGNLIAGLVGGHGRGFCGIFNSRIKVRSIQKGDWFLAGGSTGLPQGYLGAFVIRTASLFTVGNGEGLGSSGLMRNSLTLFSTR